MEINYWKYKKIGVIIGIILSLFSILYTSIEIFKKVDSSTKLITYVDWYSPYCMNESNKSDTSNTYYQRGSIFIINKNNTTAENVELRLPISNGHYCIEEGYVGENIYYYNNFSDIQKLVNGVILLENIKPNSYKCVNIAVDYTPQEMYIIYANGFTKVRNIIPLICVNDFDCFFKYLIVNNSSFLKVLICFFIFLGVIYFILLLVKLVKKIRNDDNKKNVPI